MQLKRFTDLGLRVLVFLSDKTDHPTALIDIADALQWNKNQLIKVERFMVESRLGDGGPGAYRRTLVGQGAVRISSGRLGEDLGRGGALGELL